MFFGVCEDHMIIKKILILFVTILLIVTSVPILADSSDDSSLAWNIKTKIRSTPSITSAFIEVRVQNGIATLTGMVDSPFQERDAINAAESIHGIYRVDSYITVRGTQGPNINVVPSRDISEPENVGVVPENSTVEKNTDIREKGNPVPYGQPYGTEPNLIPASPAVPGATERFNRNAP